MIRETGLDSGSKPNSLLDISPFMKKPFVSSKRVGAILPKEIACDRRVLDCSYPMESTESEWISP